jgi:hypothetical protein
MAESGRAAPRRVWDQQSVWSQAADAAKRTIERTRTVGLVLAVTAAVLSTAAAQTMAWHAEVGKVLAFLAAALAGLAPLAALRSGPAALRDWTRLRSVSEALKSELYTFLAGAGVYRASEAGEDPAGVERTLLSRTEDVITDAADLAWLTAAHTPRSRALPPVFDVDSYVTIRVAGQIRDYYRPRATQMGRRSTVVHRVELLLAATAALLSAAAGAFGTDQAAAWVATVTTVAAAVTAHAAAARYAYQELEFSRTAAELESLLVRRTAACHAALDNDDAFVERCELIISAQNEAWMAKWATD